MDSVIVATNHCILEKQIKDTSKQFMQVGNIMVWAEHSDNLTKDITDGKRTIVTMVERTTKRTILLLSLMRRTLNRVDETSHR